MGYKKTFKRYWKAKQNHAKHKKLMRLEFAHAYAVDKNRIKPSTFILLSKKAKGNATAVDLHRMLHEVKTSGGTIYKEKFISFPNNRTISISGKSISVEKIEEKLSGYKRSLPRYSKTYKLWLSIKYIDSKKNKNSSILDF